MKTHLLIATAIASFLFAACRGDSEAPARVPDEPGEAGAPEKAGAPGEDGPGEDGAQAEAEAPLPLWDAVRREVLPNGLTSYVMSHPFPPGRALVWLAIDAGSVQEEDAQRGLAHLVEHMAFSGTRNFEGQAIVRWAESIGMGFGAHVNAYTSFDETVYTLEVPTDDPAHLKRALAVARDWADGITFDAAALDRERLVVLEERRLRRGASERLVETHFPVMLKGSRYAARMPIGTPEVIEGAPRETLLEFYGRWYTPGRMAVFVVGDVEAEETQGAIREAFEGLEAAGAGAEWAGPGMPEPGMRISIAKDDELPRTTVTLYEMLPRRPEGTRTDYRRALAEALWQMVVGERIAAVTRRDDAPFDDAGFSIDSPVRAIDALSGHALARKGAVGEALRGLLEVRVGVERAGIQEDELRRARSNLSRFYEDYDRGLATTPSRLFAEEMTRNFFEGELMVGAAAEKAMALELLPEISAAEVARAGAVFAAGGRRVVLISAAGDEVVPEEEALRALIEEVMAAEPAGGAEEEVGEARLVAEAPAPGRIVEESFDARIGVTTWVLGNGARVMVKPTDFAIDAVSIGATSPGGYAAADDAMWPHARYALAALSQGGVGAHDPVALGKLLAGKSASASVVVGETTEGVMAGGSAQDLETIFELMWLQVTAPRVDEAAVQRWSRRYREGLETEERQPERRFALEVGEALYAGHPRRLRATAEEVGALDMGKALAFHGERFGDVSDFTFAIVGEVELEVLRPLVERWIGGLPGGGRVEEERDVGARWPEGVVEKTLRLGTEPRALVELRFHGEEAWSRDGQRDLNILADVLGVRLREVLREELGGVYGVQVGGRFERAPVQRRALTVSFGCAPERVEELVEAVMAEVARIGAEGASEVLLAQLREKTLRAREVQLRDNDVWVAWLLGSARFGDDPAQILDPEPYFARLKSELVAASAGRFGDRARMFKAVLLPE